MHISQACPGSSRPKILPCSSQVAVQLSSAFSGALATPDPQRQAQSAQSRPPGFSSPPRLGPLDPPPSPAAPPLPCLPGCSALLLLRTLRPRPPGSSFLAGSAPSPLTPPSAPPPAPPPIPAPRFFCLAPGSLSPAVSGPRSARESAGARERSSASAAPRRQIAQLASWRPGATGPPLPSKCLPGAPVPHTPSQGFPGCWAEGCSWGRAFSSPRVSGVGGSGCECV